MRRNNLKEMIAMMLSWFDFSARRPERTLIALVMIGLLASAGACSNAKGEKPKEKKQPTPVTVARVVEKTVAMEIRAIGNAEACASVVIKSQVGGMITRQVVRDGQDVVKGDPLFTIDPRPFDIALKEAQAKLERDMALLNQAEADLNRYSRLKQTNAISQEQYEQALVAVKTYRATVRLDETIVSRARLELEYASVKAPIAGRVGSVLVHEGNIIKANDDRSLTVINQIQPICVSFALPERYLSSVFQHMAEKKLTLSAFIENESATPETGELTSVDNAVDKQTGTIRLKGTFANADKRLWPGHFVRVVLKLADVQGTRVVPSSAVQTGIHGEYVYILTPEGKADMRSVKIGRIQDGETVIEEGLEAGETVITDGHILLTPGASVVVGS